MALRRTILEQLLVCQHCTKRVHPASRSSPGAPKMSWCRWAWEFGEFRECWYSLSGLERFFSIQHFLDASSQVNVTHPFWELDEKKKNTSRGWARTCNHSVYNGRFTHRAMGPVWLWAPLTEPGPIIVKVNRPFILQKLVFWIPKIVRACGRETRYFSKASLTWKLCLARRAHYICKVYVCTR